MKTPGYNRTISQGFSTKESTSLNLFSSLAAKNDRFDECRSSLTRSNYLAKAEGQVVLGDKEFSALKTPKFYQVTVDASQKIIEG
ncbi:MAG: hypothetical protein ACK56I_22190, partial [bacterium]